MIKAWRFYQTGGPEVMRCEDVELPLPEPGQIRIRHSAVAVNYRDIAVRNGLHKVLLPSGIGLESAGIIEAIGADVNGFAVGDHVACVAGPDGAYSEARNVPAA